MRALIVGAVWLEAVLAALLAVRHSAWWWIVVGVVAALAALGTWDLVQTRHSILRAFPILGHARFLAELIRPEIYQYFVESNTDGAPFDRETRDAVYRRAKGTKGDEPFGTERDVNAVGHEFLRHSLRARHATDLKPTVRLGGPDCTQPYDIALLNVSAMSFGALSANAIEALNGGAALGGFAHDTGEGAISPYHLKHGGDLIWEIGSGYFGCRTADGHFDPELFREKANLPTVKAISIKLSQGAKPGLGGVHRWSSCTSSRRCAVCPAANRWASSCASAPAPNSWACARPCCRPESPRTSSSSTDPRAAPAPHPRSSRITSACR